ncbi:MAG: DUF4160 domain-containing protein [Roseitalea sp.]|jgi:hypothetical protein|nr:DUF4160 domain-containing protein [Roseitalea sp.]MBO6721904.1 DUF4160 domain-containing protein [Roseitalea sp.]MBO6743075.1 DUF4160 domain-containing protein [Roseitalea sp.]
MPTVLRKYGIRFHFYGSDMDEPPHVHATGHGGKAKVWLEPMRFADHAGFKATDLKRILEVVNDHNHEILEAWHEFFRHVHRK